MKTTRAACWVNGWIALGSYGAWLYMLLFSKSEALSTAGFSSLKYFTVLSNLFNGAVALGYALHLRAGRSVGTGLKTLKLVATAAVGLTFATVIVFLGPLYGYDKMFSGANLFLHLLLPLASFISFIYLERGCRLPFRQTFWAIAPVALYAAGYILNVAVNGVGEWPYPNDFYSFFLWGTGVAAVIAVVILAGIWGIALALWRAGKAYPEKKV